MKPLNHETAFWESAAVTALGAVLATEVNCTVEESTGMAANAADLLLAAWRSRFAKEGEP